MVLSLPLLLPPLQKIRQASLWFKGLVAGCLGLLAWGVIFGFYTRVGAEAVYIVKTITGDVREGGLCGCYYPLPPEYVAEYTAYRSAIINELWQRALIPPALRQACYARQPKVCAFADDASPPQTQTWSDYGASLGISFPAALGSFLFMWLFSRRRPAPGTPA